MKRAFGLFGLLLGASVFAAGCVIIDDGYGGYDETEIIRFQNYTGLRVDNYIDEIFVGAVPAFGSIEIEGDYEGIHLFESWGEDDLMHWGPSEFSILDGEIFVVDLVTDEGFKTHSEPKPTSAKAGS